MLTVPTQPEIDKLAEEHQSLERHFVKAEGDLKAAAAYSRHSQVSVLTANTTPSSPSIARSPAMYCGTR